MSEPSTQNPPEPKTEPMYETLEACLAAGHDQAYCETHIRQEPAPTGGAGRKARNDSVAAEVVYLKTRNSELENLSKLQSDEIKKLRTELAESNASKDAEIRTKLYPVIKDAVPTVTQAELDAMSAKELATFAQTLARVDRAPSKTKPNLIVASASDAVQGPHILLDHVPSMYGKTREQILKEYGA